MNARQLVAVILSVGLVGWSSTGVAQTKEEKRLARATGVLEQMTLMPETDIPPTLLRNSEAVAVIPNLVKGGFFFGGRRGKGVLVVRSPNGEWSNPAFVTLTGGSFGWQFGAQSTDLVLVFKSRGTVADIFNRKITLGGNAAVAAGPVGRNTEAATDLQFDAEVYTYSRSRGLFLGVAVEGASLGLDERASRRYYGNKGITANQVLADQSLATPASARRFITALDQVAPAKVAGGIRPDAPPVMLDEPEEQATTYALDDPAGS